MKVDKKLVLDYVAGNDIDEVLLSKLENDADFMLAVLQFTKDKKMLKLCSAELKKDYFFIKGIINIFKDDFEFIIELANAWSSYSKQTHKEGQLNHELIEFNIFMCNLLKGKHDAADYFGMLALSDYTSIIGNLTMGLKEENDPDGFGLGFIIVEALFKDSEITKAYCAKRMLYDLFYDNASDNFEEFIHAYAHNKSIITTQGESSYLVNLIQYFDVALSRYVLIYPELLNNVKKDLIKVLDNWDNYEQNLTSHKVLEFMNQIDKYFEENILYQPWFTSTQLIEHIMRKFKLEKIFMQNAAYAEYRQNCQYHYDKDIDKNFVRKNNLIDLRYYEYALSLAEKIFGHDLTGYKEISLNRKK